MNDSVILWGQPSSTERLRFDSNLVTEEGCVVWAGHVSKLGYGVFKWRGKVWGAHRLNLVWEHAGEEQTKMFVLHSCRNTHCVSPGHLRWGTPNENSLDAVLGDTIAFGERVGTSRLKESVVRAIYREYHESGATLAQIGQKYGISASHTKRIADGFSWARATRDVFTGDVRKAGDRRIRDDYNASKEQVWQIWTLWHDKGMTQKDIAAAVGIKIHTVGAIIQQRQYLHLTRDWKIKRKPLKQRSAQQIAEEKELQKKISDSAPYSPRVAKLNAEEVAKIFIDLHAGKMTGSEASRSYGVTPSTISCIALRQRWRPVTKNIKCPRRNVCRYCSDARIT